MLQYLGWLLIAAAQESHEELLRRMAEETREHADYLCFVEKLDRAGLERDYAGPLRRLRSPDPAERRRGLETLGASGEIAAIPVIVPLLDDSEGDVAIYAGLALDRIVERVELRRRVPPYDRVALRERTEGDTDLRPLVWVIRRMLRRTGDGCTGSYAATMIRYLELRGFEPELRTLLKSRHPAVSGQAEWALRELGLMEP